ncbi:uncharacterized protein [Macrobrachium rosenbergii]|uniref:uncharacterized protein n=1 Tax=Macrobrachium rosenbergii TaxID=79674 RepID=UPI0034D47815
MGGSSRMQAVRVMHVREGLLHEDQQFVLIEYGRKRKKGKNVSERNGRKLCDRGVSAKVEMSDKACNTDEWDGMDRTYSICGFDITELNERVGVSERLEVSESVRVRERSSNIRVIESMNESLQELERSMSEWDGLVEELGEVFGNELEGIVEIVDEIESGNSEEDNVNLRENGGEDVNLNVARRENDSERMITFYERDLEDLLVSIRGCCVRRFECSVKGVGWEMLKGGEL